MHRRPRYIAALVLVVLYALIVLGPLAPLAMQSPAIAHALTGECAGDCSACGCAPERSASHSCCCWQKKQQHCQDDHDEENEPECCKKKHGENKKTASIKSRPCNSKKIAWVFGFNLDDTVYNYFNVVLFFTQSASPGAGNPVCLADWISVPPDPPPKLS